MESPTMSPKRARDDEESEAESHKRQRLLEWVPPPTDEEIQAHMAQVKREQMPWFCAALTGVCTTGYSGRPWPHAVSCLAVTYEVKRGTFTNCGAEDPLNHPVMQDLAATQAEWMKLVKDGKIDMQRRQGWRDLPPILCGMEKMVAAQWIMDKRHWPPQVLDYVKTLDAECHLDPTAPRRPFWEGFTLDGGDDTHQAVIKRLTQQDIRELGLYPTNVEDFVMHREHKLKYAVAMVPGGSDDEDNSLRQNDGVSADSDEASVQSDKTCTKGNNVAVETDNTSAHSDDFPSDSDSETQSAPSDPAMYSDSPYSDSDMYADSEDASTEGDNDVYVEGDNASTDSDDAYHDEDSDIKDESEDAESNNASNVTPQAGHIMAINNSSTSGNNDGAGLCREFDSHRVSTSPRRFPEHLPGSDSKPLGHVNTSHVCLQGTSSRNAELNNFRVRDVLKGSVFVIKPDRTTTTTTARIRCGLLEAMIDDLWIPVLDLVETKSSLLLRYGITMLEDETLAWIG